jgi:hypothetical protein
MTLQFDRTMDALMGAAGDNGYVSTYYWLPWKPESTAAREEGRKDITESRHEPGLVVLKYVGSKSAAGNNLSPSDYFTRLIYLFLVGETPTTGVDGFQIQKGSSMKMI